VVGAALLILAAIGVYLGTRTTQFSTGQFDADVLVLAAILVTSLELARSEVPVWHFDLASRAALDADGVDARERVTSGGDKDQRRKQEPDVPPEHGAECHLKIAAVRAF
jgi:hypothetical protein